MKGGSQSILIQANDCKHYIVKMVGNPQGANTIANEFLGTVIAKSVGLPVAGGHGIYLSDSFIDSNPDLWFELQSGSHRPDKGLHFASLLVGQPSGPSRPNEYISPSRVNAIKNRDSFLGMYLLDVWANHQDNRQAILRRTSDGATEAFFIDHGHMFGGPGWNFQDRPGAALHLEKALYYDLWQDERIAAWISHFQTVIPEVLSRVGDIVPLQWYRGDLNHLITELTDRLACLAELVQADGIKSWQLSAPRNTDDPLRLPDSGIHDFGTPETRPTLHRGFETKLA